MKKKHVPRAWALSRAPVIIIKCWSSVLRLFHFWLRWVVVDGCGCGHSCISLVVSLVTWVVVAMVIVLIASRCDGITMGSGVWLLIVSINKPINITIKINQILSFFDVEHCSNLNRTFRTWTFFSGSGSPPARTEPWGAGSGSGPRPPNLNLTEPWPVYKVASRPMFFIDFVYCHSLSFS
jgi:hypothetical protein